MTEAGFDFDGIVDDSLYITFTDDTGEVTGVGFPIASDERIEGPTFATELLWAENEGLVHAIFDGDHWTWFIEPSILTAMKLQKMRKACKHENVESEGYLNPCSMAGCGLNGPVTYHLNCGSQVRDVCADCGAVLYNSADEPIETKESVYMCNLCAAEGIQAGHMYCGSTFHIPA